MTLCCSELLVVIVVVTCLETALYANSFDIPIDIENAFFRILHATELCRSLLTVCYNNLFDLSVVLFSCTSRISKDSFKMVFFCTQRSNDYVVRQKYLLLPPKMREN